MKKTKILEIALAGALAFALFSCSFPGGSNSGSGLENGSGDTDDTSGTSDNGSGNVSNVNNWRATDDITDEQKTALNALNGWRVTIETNWEDHDDSVDNEKTFVFGNSNNVTWYDMTNHFEAVKKVSEQYRVWVGYKTNGVINYWAYQNALSDSGYVDLILDVAYDEMYCVNTAVFTQVGTETLLGRTCNKYTCQGKLYYTLWEDADTGITMKLEARNNSYDVNPKYFQKVTEFKTGSDVTIPDLPLPQS